MPDVWSVVLFNLGLAVVGIVAVFGIRVLIAYVTTRDYFDKHVRRVEALGFRERRIALREHTWLNVAEGPAGGIPLLLIPGQGSIWQEYAKAIPELTDTFHVLAVDVHGHGRSSWNTDDYTCAQIADDLSRVVDEVFGTPVVIAGHSSGGLIAARMAATRPDRVRAALFEDPPFFATEPDRVARTYVAVDANVAVTTFLAQHDETDWVCWYMRFSYWKGLLGPIWPLLTRSVVRQRRADPQCVPVVRWVSISINRIWESISHPYDLRFTSTFIDNSWFAGFDQAATLAAIGCPTAFLKATTRYDRQGILLAALSDDDLHRVESLLPDNHTIRLRSSHDIHFAHTNRYVQALKELGGRVVH
ncbi:MAG: alpha/beta hydrolase [Micropruina sp.]|uniref:alpha/beta fold hydrolase n=1 Tax=Micropruina sp. TaxID=2737536 RepID=UPI0039E37CEF